MEIQIHRCNLEKSAIRNLKLNHSTTPTLQYSIIYNNCYRGCNMLEDTLLGLIVKNANEMPDVVAMREKRFGVKVSQPGRDAEPWHH